MVAPEEERIEEADFSKNETENKLMEKNKINTENRNREVPLCNSYGKGPKNRNILGYNKPAIATNADQMKRRRMIRI